MPRARKDWRVRHGPSGCDYLDTIQSSCTVCQGFSDNKKKLTVKASYPKCFPEHSRLRATSRNLVALFSFIYYTQTQNNYQEIHQ